MAANAHGPITKASAGRAVPEGATGLLRIWRVGLTFVTIAVYLGLAPFGYTFFALLSALPTRDPARRARLLQGVISRAFRLMFRWLRFAGLVDVDPRRLQGELPREPCILVANHPSLTDVAAILASTGGLCSVVKEPLYRQFWIRPLLQSAGMIAGQVDNPLGGDRLLADADDRLRQGFRVLFFPEGTRSPPGGLCPFSRGAFEIACRSRVPVVPIVVRCRPPWLAKETSLLRPPATTPRTELRVLPAVDPGEYDYDSRALLGAVKELYAGHLPGVTAQPEEDRPALPTPPSSEEV